MGAFLGSDITLERPDDVNAWIPVTSVNVTFAAPLSCAIFWSGALREDCMADEEYQRFVLLNRLVSRSTSHAPEEHRPPFLSAAEALEVIDQRRKKGWAIEYFGLHESAADSERGDDARIKRGKGHDFLWLRQLRFEEKAAWRFAILLFEFVDQSKRSFSVVDTLKLTGREISGENDERGSRSAHVVIRFPIKQYDDGSYRCAIEVAHSITRGDIENFFCRQLRRQSSADESTFSARSVDKKGKAIDKTYRFTPRLELFSDIGRKLDFALSGGRELSYMTFTRRSERRSIGKSTAVMHEDVIADVEYKVSAKQGPDDPKERLRWLGNVRSHFESIGYESRMYYRNLGGGILSGQVHQALAGATDLVMCQKELISLTRSPKDWYREIDPEIADQLVALANADQLWERTK
jgi:hypothetical protein